MPGFSALSSVILSPIATIWEWRVKQSSELFSNGKEYLYLYLL